MLSQITIDPTIKAKSRNIMQRENKTFDNVQSGFDVILEENNE